MSADNNHYLVYDLHISSAFTLSELPTVDADRVSPDVSILEGSVDPVPENENGSSVRRIQASHNTCRITYDEIGSFLVTDGVKVVCDPETQTVTEQKVFRRAVENQVMAVVLLQRGLLVLHASAVGIAGQAAVFLGEQGVGKSTTAAAFHQHNHTVFGDDVIGITFNGETPHVVPGVPEIRLSKDAVSGLGIKTAVLPTGDWGPEKQYYRVGSNRSPIPLARCYVLRNGDRVAISARPGRQALFTLIQSTYAQGLLGETSYMAEHFNQCTTVLDTAEVKTLYRPRTFAQFPEVIGKVLADLNEGSRDTV